jgi:hypothetical protein
MALLNQGIFIARGSITTNTDTVIVAPQTAADQPDRACYILWVTFAVSVAGTTSRLILNDAAGGNVLARMSTVTADSLLNINYTTTYKDYPGNRVTGINVTTSGGAAATVNYEICYQVK